LRAAVLTGTCVYIIAVVTADFVGATAGVANQLRNRLGPVCAGRADGWSLLRSVELQPVTGIDTERGARAASTVDQTQLARLEQAMSGPIGWRA
jgi:hypothetical protein